MRYAFLNPIHSPSSPPVFAICWVDCAKETALLLEARAACLPDPRPLRTHAGLRYAGRLVHTRGFHLETYLGFLLIPLEFKRCSLLNQLNRRRQETEKVEPSPGGQALNLETRHKRENKKRDSEHGWRTWGRDASILPFGHSNLPTTSRCCQMSHALPVGLLNSFLRYIHIGRRKDPSGCSFFSKN